MNRWNKFQQIEPYLIWLTIFGSIISQTCKENIFKENQPIIRYAGKKITFRKKEKINILRSLLYLIFQIPLHAVLSTRKETAHMAKLNVSCTSLQRLSWPPQSDVGNYKASKAPAKHKSPPRPPVFPNALLWAKFSADLWKHRPLSFEILIISSPGILLHVFFRSEHHNLLYRCRSKK